MSRRRATRLAAVGIFLGALAAGLAAAQPGEAPAHPAPAPGGVEDAEGLSGVTTRVLCPCGTCVNQTLHECTCGTAAAERSKIADALASGRDAESIVQEYVDTYGVQILTTPDKEGLNFVGWLVPFVVTLGALAALTWILLSWSRRPAPVPSPGAKATAPDGVDRGYRERLERELRDFRA